MAEPEIRRMSVDEFLAWEPGDGERYELVDGQPRAMTGARIRHDRIVRRVLRLLEDRTAGGPCEPFSSDIGIHTPRGDLRRPDVTVDCGPRDPDDTVARRPVVVVEVLSPSTKHYDLLVKIIDYKAIPSLRHILFVEPDDLRAILYSRSPDGSWTELSLIGADTEVDLAAIGARVRLGALYGGDPGLLGGTIDV
ncbi:Uma2 family endonuclease [Prosthecodimorpha staleyi]|uniref:Uma2 family endonuclease n=1 Tax=Prosthecodimorpha staleyi TaxID=2840188 RepID=A0A947D8F3_9HYPH|nr:Uma2 family endonuclease [Prosthecodimorpha staleyi]MBT9293025.1 Uma2 family endonuclease [Prosthecodimorpha staleyi]